MPLLKPRTRVYVYYYETENGTRELLMDTTIKNKGDIMIGSVILEAITQLKKFPVALSTFTVGDNRIALYYRKVQANEVQNLQGSTAETKTIVEIDSHTQRINS